MVGLSIVLESLESENGVISKKKPQVINKVHTTTLIIKPFTKSSSSSSSSSSTSRSSPSSSSVLQETPNFLQRCYLCKRKLLPGKDIYMYKGDKGFCSVECRCRQIFMDEEETLKKDSCSSRSRSRKPTRNRANGFVY